jgi:hypothetical protein
MKHMLQIASLLLVFVGVSLGDETQSAKEPPAPAPAKPAPAKPGSPNPGTPKQGIQKGEARLLNPGNVAVRLFRMSPEEREHALEKLPSEQARDNARKLLEWYDSLPKAAQEAQLRRLERFANLPPERKAEVRELIREANQLEGPRRTAVGRALALLQQMPDDQREATLRRPAFRVGFSAEELRIVTGLADAWMGPQ